MLIRMRVQRTFQDAGIERVLEIGREYDVSDVVGNSLVATTAAVAVVETDPEPASSGSTPAATAPARSGARAARARATA